jgi:hypothetical protein
MILHAASMAALFVDQLAQAPVQIQCVQQPTPESWLKWLLQFALSIVPVAGGVWIALWSFHATSKRDHERWILDQKKAEWKELLVKIAEIEHELPIVFEPQEEHENLVAAAQSKLPLLRGALFVFPTLESSGFINEWVAFVEYLLKIFMPVIHADHIVQNPALSGPAFANDREQKYLYRKEKEIEARNKFGTLLEELRNLAHNSLGMKDEQP